MTQKRTVDEIFEDFSETAWDQDSKWALLTRFLDQNPNPADRTNEKLEEFLNEQYNEECGFNDDDEVDPDEETDL